MKAKVRKAFIVRNGTTLEQLACESRLQGYELNQCVVAIEERYDDDPGPTDVTCCCTRDETDDEYLDRLGAEEKKRQDREEHANLRRIEMEREFDRPRREALAKEKRFAEYEKLRAEFGNETDIERLRREVKAR